MVALIYQHVPPLLLINGWSVRGCHIADPYRHEPGRLLETDPCSGAILPNVKTLGFVWPRDPITQDSLTFFTEAKLVSAVFV